MTEARLRLGAAGERQAAAWYEAHGYRVVARNWRGADGEIDLILTRDRLTVFCEVKTRTSAAFGVPAEAVGRIKQRKVRQLAMAWADQAAVRPREIRFDVAAILAGELEIIEGAF